MTYTDLRNTYTAKYGINDIAHLADLGGDAEKIICDLSERLSEPPVIGFPENIIFAPESDPSDDANIVNKAIRDEIEHLYFKKLTRSEAAAIVKALRLTFNQSIDVCGVSYNDWAFLTAWNKANAPEELHIAEDDM